VTIKLNSTVHRWKYPMGII